MSTGVSLDELERRLGKPLFDYQREAVAHWRGTETPQPRLGLYHRTGAGKTTTALIAMAERGVQEVLVVTPPATYDAWIAAGRRLGVAVNAISHAKFRQRGFLVRRDQALIADEVHMFGGHDKQGWKKLDRLAKGLQAPLIVASATPNYNDAERVYCIQHVLDPKATTGGFLEFIYQNCRTKQNPYGQIPLVEGFLHFKDAEDFLSSLPYVSYVPDELVWSIEDVEIEAPLPDEFEEYGLDRRRNRLMASGMETLHRKMAYQLLNEDGTVRDETMDMLIQMVGEATTPVLIFCNSSRLAEALFQACNYNQASVALLTGKDTVKRKQAVIEEFKKGRWEILIGTSTLATGVDGIDKMCDTLIIVNDTSDDALRRQLVGRIMPRGADADATGKHVYRLVYKS